MKLENGRVKPCSACYRARQRMKELAGTVIKGKATHTVALTSMAGEVIINNATRRIEEVAGADYSDLVGTEAYVAGEALIDVGLARPIKRVGRVTRVTRQLFAPNKFG